MNRREEGALTRLVEILETTQNFHHFLSFSKSLQFPSNSEVSPTFSCYINVCICIGNFRNYRDISVLRF